MNQSLWIFVIVVSAISLIGSALVVIHFYRLVKSRDATGRKEYRKEMGSFSSVEFVLLRHRGGDYGSV